MLTLRPPFALDPSRAECALPEDLIGQVGDAGRLHDPDNLQGRGVGGRARGGHLHPLIEPAWSVAVIEPRQEPIAVQPERLSRPVVGSGDETVERRRDRGDPVVMFVIFSATSAIRCADAGMGRGAATSIPTQTPARSEPTGARRHRAAGARPRRPRNRTNSVPSRSLRAVMLGCRSISADISASLPARK